MKDIKTKDAAKKDIKVLDKTGNLAKAVRDLSVRTKDQIENLSDDGQVTPEEYANDKIKYADFGCEIVEVAKRCIQCYEKEKGLFLHYFIASWNKEYRHIISKKTIEDNLRGLKITEEDRRNLVKIKRLASLHNSFSTYSEWIKHIQDTFRVSKEYAIYLLEMSNISFDYKSNDEEEESIEEYIPANEDVELEYEKTENERLLLLKFENIFNCIQERQQTLISDLLTSKLIEAGFEIKAINKYGFYSKVIERIVTCSGMIPTQREIAAMHQKNEASISRTWKNFVIRIRENENDEPPLL